VAASFASPTFGGCIKAGYGAGGTNWTGCARRLGGEAIHATKAASLRLRSTELAMVSRMENGRRVVIAFSDRIGE
jgi:hypothetical protein